MPGADKWAKDRVEESIKRLKLNEHDALPSERRRIWRETTIAINDYLDAKTKFDTRTNPAASVIIEEKARTIRNLTKAEAELSAVAQWCVLFRNDIGLSRLVS